MSRILRRPMFRGGRVDSRGTGITSNLGYQAGGRVGLNKSFPGTVGQAQLSYEDQLALSKYNANREYNKQFTYPSVIERMNDYYNKLYTQGMNQTDLDEGLQISPTYSGTDLAQMRTYENNPEEFQSKFFSGKFDGRNYDKIMAENSKNFKKFNPGEKDPYVNPEVETLETGTGNGNGNVTGDIVKKLSDKEKMKANQELFAEMLDKKGARIEDASNMALSFAGKAFEDEATVKSAFGKFFEEESKRPSSTRKIDQSAAALAINDYIAGKRSAEQTELFLEKLKLSQGSLADKYNEARKVENNKGKAFATALYNKEGKDLKQVNKIPESIDDIKELNLNNGDIILAPNEVNGNKVLSVLQVIISSNGNVSTVKYFPDL